MSFTEQDALSIAKATIDDYRVGAIELLCNDIMSVYHKGLEDGKTYEVKRAFWDGVKVGVERYSYYYQPSGYKNPSYRAVGPDGTTHLDAALYNVDREAQEALNGTR